MGLTGTLHKISDLSGAQITTMFGLMTTHYANVRQQEFESDLAEKDYAILLSDPSSGQIKGFSTQMLMDHRFDGEDMLVVFSGDTIIDPQHWGSIALPVSFGEMMFSIMSRHPGRKLFWMLISKGFRTYRFLPVFFKNFYPRHDQQTPSWEKQLMNSLGNRKFPDRYNETTGIVKAGSGAQVLRENLASASEHRQEQNPHIKFFLQSNPGHVHGDEIVCLCPFHSENLRGFILRELKKRGIPMDTSPSSRH